MKLFYLGAFGLVGIFSRYFLGQMVEKHFHSPFPSGTLFINVLGSFLIGVAYVLGTEKAVLSPDVQVGIAVGLLGGFTTFSAFSLETMRLMGESRFTLAALYFCLSPVAGVISALAGAHLTRQLL